MVSGSVMIPRPNDEQPPLPLGWMPRLGEADFFVSEANRAAVEWLARPDAWPMARVLLIGPEGSGKTHLAGLVATRSGARFIDDADLIKDGEPLFHAWNAATPERPLLLTGRRLPRNWPHRLPDLASRLSATPLVMLVEPDDELLAAVIAKRFSDRGLRVSADVIGWLSLRIERSFVAAEHVVSMLDAASLAERREITIPWARVVLEAQLDMGF